MHDACQRQTTDCKTLTSSLHSTTRDSSREICETSRVELSLLPSIVLAIAEQRSLNDVLTTIIRIVGNERDVALARLWLVEKDDTCPHCRGVAGEPALHLRASAGTSLDPNIDWSRTNGTFHKIPLNAALKISHIAST